MLSGAAVLTADVIDRTLLPLFFLSFSFSKVKKPKQIMQDFWSESERITGTVPWHSGSVCETVQLGVLLRQ